MYVVALTLLLNAVLALPADVPVNIEKKQAVNCPLYLPDNFEYPHLIVPISAAAPNTTLGNTYTPAVSPDDVATVFNFDIPPSRAGQTCTLYFTFPKQSQLVTSSFTYSGLGVFQFAQYEYNYGATAQTTWNSQPPLASVPPTTIANIGPGNAYRIWSGSCGPGGVFSWKMSSPDSCLWYFQDYNECALGMYVLYG